MNDLVTIARRSFSIHDQRQFAAFSGDLNPIHVDPIYARRSLAGAPVVHGIHLLIWVLESALEYGLLIGKPESLQVQFRRPAQIDVQLVCGYKAHKAGTGTRFYVFTQEGDELLWIEISPGKVAVGAVLQSGSFQELVPLCHSWSDIKTMSGDIEILFSGEYHKLSWPRVCLECGVDFLALLTSTSRLVGMQCPGLDSLYSELKLERLENGKLPRHSLRYSVTTVDARFKLVNMSLQTASYIGGIRAFVRPKLKSQPTLTDVRQKVPAGAFHHQRALVVGGSRGIGEVAAKVLAAGGANVFLTYSTGKEDAERVVAEIRNTNTVVNFAKLDVTIADGTSEALIADFRPTHLFYCATPFIFAGRRDFFSQVLLERFLDYYVTGFERVLRLAYAYGLRDAWFPSSIALEDKPSDMREYCSAKLSAEKLVASLLFELKDLKISCPRLPRVATDQTNTLFEAENEDLVSVLLTNLFRKL